ncbi:MAG: leucine-rich repeat domain-containing protein [Promethearchaeota archaeon]
MTTAKCVRCGNSHSMVDVIATCSNCGGSVTLCHTCKIYWSSSVCPLCGASRMEANWVIKDPSGEDNNFSQFRYVKDWVAKAEEREAERGKEGVETHRGVALPAEEVKFLRDAEDLIFKKILTDVDEKASYVVVEGGHVVKLRFYNAELRKNLPGTISQLKHLREFWFEMRKEGSLLALPDSFSDLTTLETIVLNGSAPEFPPTASFPNLKKLAILRHDCPDSVFKFTGIEELSLGGCWFKREQLENLGVFTNLKKLQLSHISIHDGSFNAIPESIKKLVNLEEIDLRGLKVGNLTNNPWPSWLVEDLPNLKVVHRDIDTLYGWDAIETALHERNPEVHLGNILDPEYASRRMNLSDMENWWSENNSDALKAGWTGITSRV